jgi:polyisoprenoid-binding protein YceI
MLEEGLVSFFSSAPLEDITATNSKTKSVFDSDKGEIAFSIPIKEFQFKKSLMQEHFNEKYLESDKYPKSSFSGKVTGYLKGIANDNVWAEGTLDIHGVKNQIKVPGVLNFNGDKVHLECKFMIKLEDYKIKIPSVLFQNIAEEVEITLNYDYKLYKK